MKTRKHDRNKISENTKITLTFGQIKKLIKESITENENARELALYIENDAVLYKQAITPTILNFKRKIVKGIYDPDKALIQWKRVADLGAKKYEREYGTPGARIFSVEDRMECAKELQEFFQEEIEFEDDDA